MTSAKLRKSSKEKVFFGVAGGMAEYFSVDATLVRFAFILACFGGGVGFIAYIVLAVIMPSEETDATQRSDVMRENLQNIPGEAAQAARRVGDTFREVSSSAENRRRNTFAMILMALGAVLLLANLGLFWWFDWSTLWPLVLIAIGAAIILGRVRRT